MTTDAEVTPQANSHAVKIKMAKSELEARFDKYWNEVKDVLPEHVLKEVHKGGFRKVTRQRVIKVCGGVTKFYEPTLIEIVDQYLDTQPRQALAFVKVSFLDEGDTSTVTGLVFLEPEVRWLKKPGIEEPLTIKLVKTPDNTIDLLVEEELRKKQTESVVLEPVETTPVKGSVVIIDCVSSLVGEDGSLTKWDPGCLLHAKWSVEPDHIKQPELYEAILGIEKEVPRVVSMTLNEKFGPEAGRKVSATITVRQTYAKRTPEVDDDLAKTNGFDTLEGYKNNLRVHFARKLAESREKLLNSNLTAAIVHPDVVDVDPIPYLWMSQKAKDLYMEGRSYCSTESDFLSKFAGAQCMSGEQVVDKETLLRFLGEKAAQEFVQDLVLRSWGKLKGVAGNSVLRNLPSYVQSVREELAKVAVIEDLVVQDSE